MYTKSQHSFTSDITHTDPHKQHTLEDVLSVPRIFFFFRIVVDGMFSIDLYQIQLFGLMRFEHKKFHCLKFLKTC